MEKAEKFAATDRCVKCGLCLPHCPTYVKTRDENESPRGRLALIQAWSNDALPADGDLLDHLDNCLLCRACERVCPAQVPYGYLVDDFRAEHPHKSSEASLTSRLKTGVLKHLVDDRKRMRMARKVLGSVHNALEKTGLNKLQTFQELNRMENADARHEPLQAHYAATGEKLGSVGLFTGCMGELFDQATVYAAIKVLTRLGYDVEVPELQTCCGALALHEGQRNEAQQMARQNIAAFPWQDLSAVVSLASGCGATLLEYGDRLTDDDASQFSGKLKDICTFIAQQQWPDAVKIEPLAARAVLHTPCTLKNVMRQEASAANILGLIPELELTALPATTLCCGAAGSYMLEHPKMAGQLRSDILSHIRAEKPDLFLTSNIGCAIHLSNGLAEDHQSIPTLHPVTLLARQIAD